MPVNIEKIDYSIYGKCLVLTNGTVEVIMTTDIGPRVIAYRFVGGENILGELPASNLVSTEFGDFHAWGGHRLWAAPEAKPRSYWPDNDPVKVEIAGSDTVRLIPPLETGTQLQKEMTVKLDSSGSGVTVNHKVTNKGIWAIELAAWGLTVMRSGGATIVPQEPFKSHSDEVLPARPMVMWGYTDLTDSRWTVGKEVHFAAHRRESDPSTEDRSRRQAWVGGVSSRQHLLYKEISLHRRRQIPRLRLQLRDFHRGFVYGSGEPRPLLQTGSRADRGI